MTVTLDHLLMPMRALGSAYAAAAAAAPPHRRTAIISAANDRERLGLIVTSIDHVRHDTYRDVPIDIAVALVLGLPVGEGLTRSERHEWLLAGANVTPITWVLRGCQRAEARSMAVARWVVVNWATIKSAKCDDNEPLTHHLLDLQESDIAGGAGVAAAIARRADRMAEGEFGGEPLAPVPAWFRPMPGVTVLNTAPMLSAEGRKMKHCVGGYARQVQSGACVIAAITTPMGARATVEYSPIGKIVQIKGPCNADPTPDARRLAALAGPA